MIDITSGQRRVILNKLKGKSRQDHKKWGCFKGGNYLKRSTANRRKAKTYRMSHKTERQSLKREILLNSVKQICF